MPIDSQADVHVDQVLSNLVLDYKKAELIGNQIIPVLTVKNDTGIYYEWLRNSINITGMNTVRQDRSFAHELNIDVTTGTYSMTQYAAREFLEDGIRKNSDSVLNIQERYSQQVIDVMDLIKEKKIADTVFDANNYAAANKTTLSGNDRWNQITQAASDPKEDIATAQRAVLLEAGVWAQSLVIGFDLHQKLKRHNNILASVQYVQRTGVRHINDAEIMDYLGVTSLYVGAAVYNSAAEGLTANNAFVWNSHALLFYDVPAGGGINVPAFGYEFRPSHTPRTVSRYSENGRNGEWVEVNEKYFHKLTFPKAGYLFVNADN